MLYRLADERNGENVELILNGVPIIILQDMADTDYVLRLNASNYEKNMAWFRQALGLSRITEDGKAWQLRQQISQSYLSKFDRQYAFESTCKYSKLSIDRVCMSGANHAERLDDNIFREMAAGVMLESFFNRTLSDTGVDVDDIARMIAFGSEYSFVPAGRKLSLDAEITRTFLDVRKKVLNALKSFREEPAPSGSLLESLRNLDREGTAGFVLEHELTLFFAAGAETTAASLGWACHLLAKHPSIQEELRKEVDAFWNSNNPNWTSLEEVESLHNFVAEVLRIFPPTPVVGRLAKAADRIGALNVQAGASILVSLVGLHHDRRHRPEPWKLDIKPRVANGKSMAKSIPFSIGPRICGGARFALVEMVSALSVFLREARFELTSDGAPRFKWQSQLLHEGGQPVRAIALR